MKTLFKNLAAAGALALAATTVSAQSADEGDNKFEKAAEYYGDCSGVENADFEAIEEQVRAFTDMVVMAETLNDPVKLFTLMDAINDPHTMHVMAKCSMEPVMWDTWMEGMFNPGKWMEASLAIMNPEGMVAWTMAPLNGDIYKLAANHLNPDKYVKWGTALINPTFYEPLTDMLAVEWYEPRLAWFVEAESYAPMLQMFDLDAWKIQ